MLFFFTSRNFFKAYVVGWHFFVSWSILFGIIRFVYTSYISLLIIFLFQSFNACHQQIKSIRRTTLQSCTGLETVVAKNLVTYLVNRLQELTERFRSSQNDYLKSKKGNKHIDVIFFFHFSQIKIILAVVPSLVRSSRDPASIDLQFHEKICPACSR